jgi:hypothetical protein
MAAGGLLRVTYYGNHTRCHFSRPDAPAKRLKAKKSKVAEWRKMQQRKARKLAELKQIPGVGQVLPVVCVRQQGEAEGVVAVVPICVE